LGTRDPSIFRRKKRQEPKGYPYRGLQSRNIMAKEKTKHRQGVFVLKKQLSSSWTLPKRGLQPKQKVYSAKAELHYGSPNKGPDSGWKRLSTPNDNAHRRKKKELLGMKLRLWGHKEKGAKKKKSRLYREQKGRGGWRQSQIIMDWSMAPLSPDEVLQDGRGKHGQSL